MGFGFAGVFESEAKDDKSGDAGGEDEGDDDEVVAIQGVGE